MVFSLSAPSAVVALLMTVFASCPVPAAHAKMAKSGTATIHFLIIIYLPLLQRSGWHVFVDPPVFHHKRHPPNRRDVLERISIHGDDISRHTWHD